MKFIKKLILSLFFLLLLAACAVGGHFVWQGYQIYQQVIQETPLADKVEEIRSKPHYTTISQLPDIYKNAVVAVEDKRFYRHGGIDLLSTGRAVVTNIREKKLAEGGSSITQQLAKNLYFTQEKVLTRKAAEAFMAWAIEKQYTKDEILELYVNSIYFGSGYYNVRQASEGYFGKAPAQMTPYECTLLAGVPNAPSAYDPAQNPGLARQRQKKVVEQMVERGCLSAAQAREALTPG